MLANDGRPANVTSMIGAPGPRLAAVLGPTNTGKTYLAVERMLGHESGMIGFPLRLLARENYDRIRKIKGEGAVALVTGEEKILPASARYFVCTVESMPLDRPVGFLAIDEIQMAADPERGHVFTDRLLHARGLDETMLLGAETMRPLLRRLLPGLEIITRPRFSVLRYSGPRKPTRLPPRSAVVAFSAGEVYRIAEMMRRQRGGCAVVMGALSPRTRNAQVEMYQAGEVDHLVATDAIGMGLNMDLLHVGFAGLSKFDGRGLRRLSPAELAQIAGRAGRHMSDGSFGTTAELGALSPETVEAIENHRFDAIAALMWRNSDLDFHSIETLRASLEQRSPEPALIRAREADDQLALAQLGNEPDVLRRNGGPATVRLLWEVCQIPDFRKVMSDAHTRLLAQVFRHLTSSEARLPTDWVSGHVARLDRTDGDIDTLMARIAHIRTWTYISYRPSWLADPVHWQERTRAVEDRLSDALHRSLTQRFVDRRQAHLLRRMKDGGALMGLVTKAGEVIVEGHGVGQLAGFRFIPDGSGGVEESRPLLNAARRALSREIPQRLARLESASDQAFSLSHAGIISWEGAPVARLVGGETAMRPRVDPLQSDLLDGAQRERLRRRLAEWLERHIARQLKPLVAAKAAASAGATRGLLFQLIEALGLLPRRELAAQLPLADTKTLAKLGVRLGCESVWFPALASAASLAGLLWCLKAGRAPAPLPPRRPASILRDPALPAEFYHAVGYRLAGALAIRADVLERLSLAARRLAAQGAFLPVEALRQTIHCEAAALPAVIAALGYRSVEVAGELRFEAPAKNKALSRKRRRARRRRPGPVPDSPFAALSGLKFPR
jgi:ATP-dependent RNA helicase SUPV3L1/SUV3